MGRRKRREKCTKYGTIGISFTTEELIAALIQGSLSSFASDAAPEPPQVHLLFEVITKEVDGNTYSGIDTKVGSLQEFLIKRTQLATKIADGVDSFILSCESEEPPWDN